MTVADTDKTVNCDVLLTVVQSLFISET